MELGVHTNPNLELLDRIYNASLQKQPEDPSQKQDHGHDDDEEESGDGHSCIKGAIIQKNINLAPFYRDYNLQKRDLLSWINQSNIDAVRMQGENILKQKMEYNKFSLKKWEIKRNLVNKLFDVLI